MIKANNQYDSLFDVTQIAQSQQLRALAHQKDKESLSVLAKQFESFFLDSMMQSMRGASKGLGLSDLFHSRDGDFYQEMYDQQLSLNMAQHGGLGLSDLIERQLSGGTAFSQNTVKEFVNHIQSKLQNHSETDQQAAKDLNLENEQQIVPEEKIAALSSKIDKAFEDPASFVKALWDGAVKIAEQLGLDPKLLIAQAALETGWGQAILKEGEHFSHNLFNIKADPSWLGDKIVKDTLEFEDNLPVKKKEAFRSYDSFADSFEDYFSFLKNNPRYSTTLSLTNDPGEFLGSLQEAGYATDPNYANKIYQIYHGETLNHAIDTMFTR